MGLFDGYSGSSKAGSTSQMAEWLKLPVLLVIDARSMARSAAALVHGFTSFDPKLSFAGVVFNRIGSLNHLGYLQEAIAEMPGVKSLGGIPRDEEIEIPERHLGLVTTEDLQLGEEYFDRLADHMESHLNIDGLLSRLQIQEFPVSIEETEPPSPSKVRIGVARDKAFCFYYPENLDLLEQNGAELVSFSPLNDNELPEELDAIYLGGGYPEIHASRLAENRSMRASVLQVAREGMPIYAECGGFMYLCNRIEDLEGKKFDMVGVFDCDVKMLSRLKALGYREVVFQNPTLLGSRETRVRGHEFHYSEITSEPGNTSHDYLLTARTGNNLRPEGYRFKNVLAGYVHLHFANNPEIARNFVEFCSAKRNP